MIKLKKISIKVFLGIQNTTLLVYLINYTSLSQDKKTLKIDFSVTQGNNWSAKKGRSTIDDIINLLNYESMYGIQDFREHYLKFLQKTIL